MVQGSTGAGERCGDRLGSLVPPVCPVLCYVLSRLVCLKSHPRLWRGEAHKQVNRYFKRLSDMLMVTQSGRGEI